MAQIDLKRELQQVELGIVRLFQARGFRQGSKQSDENAVFEFRSRGEWGSGCGKRESYEGFKETALIARWWLYGCLYYHYY